MTTRLDCWNEIGVTGDRSCVELAEHTHCRNCPSYASAAGSRLDRPVSDAAIDAATAYYAAPREIESLSTAACFVFRIGSEWLGIPIGLLDEVVASKPTHSLPHRRGAVRLGLVSIRSDILVHVSLAGLLGIPDDASSPDNSSEHRRRAPRVVVLHDQRGRLAMSVDEVMGIHQYDPTVLRAVPSTLGQALVSYTHALLAVGDRMVGVLDGSRVLASMSQVLA
ncbi:MAG TPA: chemotaxis protein CheW [Gemmatimonadaceae bacterium]|nr:chemotaxis protein CheW [Gemmatimonadaceae bacterium]